ncbi:N4-gp56 family major capsid protein [Acinetobacter sp. CFCC 10889]|uniref:N4-gp56 family major capsid protein n=1 Tax=Acinetobacter sp. CFCC 10889 TaxID=1775557 RepID=UPI000DCFCA0F|nr:N4-gp56 family major capsid protein [Acinetobacter sp. CFCC 10889]
MGQTVINAGASNVPKKWAGVLFNATVADSFFLTNMTDNSRSVDNDGEMANAPVVVLNHLEKSAGEDVHFEVYMQVSGNPTYGDDTLEGNETDLESFSDEIRINQVRKAVSAGGRMTQKRTETNLRNMAKVKLSEYFSKYVDQVHFTNLAGARGINADYELPLGVDYAIPKTHKFSEYDADHKLYGGNATSKATLTATDTMKLTTIERALTKAKAEGGGSDMKIRLDPLKLDGQKNAFIVLMHTYQAHDLRADVGTKGWFEIQKALTTAEGKKSQIFSGALGWHQGACLKEHKDVVRFNDFGAGKNVQGARAAIMGRQALVTAFGNAASKGKMRMGWEEEWKDYKNKLSVATGMIFNVKRPEFDGKTYGSFAIDTAHTSGTAEIIN